MNTRISLRFEVPRFNVFLVCSRWSCLALLGAWLAGGEAQAATVTLNVSDSGSISSFNSAGGWSNDLAPSAGNAYTVSTKTLFTPVTSGSFAFAGDSLTIENLGVLEYKGTGTADTITVTDLTLFTGSTVTDATKTGSFTLAGTIILNTGEVGKLQVANGDYGFTVTSTISGAGSLSLTTSSTAATTQAVTLAAANTFSGGTTIGAATGSGIYANVIAAADGAFGTGNVTVNGGNLTFQLGTTNQYIAPTGDFILTTGLTSNAINLNFTGIDVIAGLSLNNGTNYLASGIYDATELDTLYGSNVFTGSGEFTVGAVPEPNTSALLVFALGVIFLAGWMRRWMEQSTF